MHRTVSKLRPPATSCLTCQRRRKKCDMSKPCCDRCLRGGYECLGYGDDNSYSSSDRDRPSIPVLSRSGPIFPDVPVEVPLSGPFQPHVSSIVALFEDRRLPCHASADYDLGPSILGAAMLYKPSGAISSDNGTSTTTGCSKNLDRSWSQNRSRSTILTYQVPCAERLLDTTSSVRPISYNLVGATAALCESIPPSVDATRMMREDHFVRVVNEYNLRRVGYWFIIPTSKMHDMIMTHAKRSKKLTWIMYLGAKLFQALAHVGTCGPVAQEYIGWIDRLEQNLIKDSRSLSRNDMGECLMIQLELAFLKFTVADSVSAYNMIQKALPRFLQLVAVDPSLYMEQPNGNLVVSFHRTLISVQSELRRFVIYDTIAALVLGVPPLVHYGYDDEYDDGLDLIRGIPVALAGVISQINAWRAGSSGALENWQALERQVLAWKPLSIVMDEDSASEATSVARETVQESWRHVALIYIYMGMCRVSSHDSRVQAAVHRIAQLGETVANLPISVHMFVHYVVAGLSARLEKHRVFIYEKLLSFQDMRVWLFHGPQFVQVLYHLWHGDITFYFDAYSENMSRIIPKPGPPRTSCLTCRRRRKKCDMTKPCCERCLRGGYECSGYEGNKPRSRARHKEPSEPIPSQLQPLSPTVPLETARAVLDSATLSTSENRPTLITTGTDHDLGPSILGAAVLYRMKKRVSSANHGCVTPESESSEDFNRSWPQDKIPLNVHSRSLSQQSSRATGTVGNDKRRTMEDLCQSIPPSVDATQMIEEGYLIRVVSEYRSQRLNYWFISPPPTARISIVNQVSRTMRMTRVLSVGATFFFRTIGQNKQTYDSTVRGYIGWVNKIEQGIASDSHSNLPLDDVANHLMIELEIVFLKFTFPDSVSGYISLQKALPMFLRLVAADPNLHMEQPDGNLVVSFPGLLASPHYELRRFIVYDAVAALLLGVPPLVDYGYDEESDSGFDGVRGIPVALLEVISRVNSWRAGSRRTPDTWEILEMRVLAWKIPSTMRDDTPVTENGRGAQIAVLESWRYVALIYIYMGVCGVSSHDSRVQDAVHRIVQFGETVSNSPVGVHMLGPYIVAGLAARLEKHRVVLYKQLLSLKHMGVWLFHGPQFSQILYHLWHGIGMGGAPVMWDDYVQSRYAIIPI
ncbi:unnamed protein product [Rhizoctonia solani]|uniref:Zn(2)-C6 fungal-type domain-containing protein n=1 Tax=Rhizoctonia solani TaxID=456999 RepID=A0A8H2ZVM9_9AGAM|nr:unnamed protein product [Rhizoctonia solani]